MSDEQLKVIGAKLDPLSVVACAGSGKTHTAVRRLVTMRRQLGVHRGRVALLSFSNVAVETFRKEYEKLARDDVDRLGRDRVEIDTLDSFITGNVLRPHAYRSMGARQAAYLVTGDESFLSGFKVRTKTFPHEIDQLQVGFRAGSVYFYCQSRSGAVEDIPKSDALALVHRLGQTGAYTHNLGRYWCYRTLKDEPLILRALTRRYPYMLIDEAQDIGTMHEAIVEQLIVGGCIVSLIGDPNQGIYEFADATGEFLTRYGQRAGIEKHELTRNYRSVPAILNLANKLTSRADSPNREAPKTAHGVFFAPYKKGEEDNLIEAFQTTIRASSLAVEQSAVLCRGRDMANKLAGNEGAPGAGIVKGFAKAAILRDKHQDYLGAFRAVVSGVVALLADPPQSLVAMITQAGRYPDMRPLRRLIWAFTRNPDSGLPGASLIADAQWHAKLQSNVKALLGKIAKDAGLSSASSLGNKLANRNLPNAPLMAEQDLVSNERVRIRVDTVHRAKGESLDAVLYLATKEHARALLEGAKTELGRIGYVAVTRARDLFWLGVPTNALKDLESSLVALGFRKIGEGKP